MLAFLFIVSVRSSKPDKQYLYARDAVCSFLSQSETSWLIAPSQRRYPSAFCHVALRKGRISKFPLQGKSIYIF